MDLTLNTPKQRPSDYIESVEPVCSNIDHAVNLDVVERLKTENIWAPYPAWNFYGNVWWDKEDNLFYCMVWRYNSHIDTISSENASDLMSEVSNKYGWD